MNNSVSAGYLTKNQRIRGMQLSMLLFIFFLSLASQAQISENTLLDIFTAFHKAYHSELEQKKTKFVFNYPDNKTWWHLEDTRASYNFYKNPNEEYSKHYIFVFGGYARLNGMTEEGVLWVLCHEIGHGIGGSPHKANREYPVSVEAQADYYSTNICLEKVFKQIPAQDIMPNSAYAKNLCESQNTLTLEDCLRGFKAIEGAQIFFRLAKNIQTETDFTTPDTNIAKKLDLSDSYYPSPQCRIDTMVAGLLKQARPVCWYPATPGAAQMP